MADLKQGWIAPTKDVLNKCEQLQSGDSRKEVKNYLPDVSSTLYFSSFFSAIFVELFVINMYLTLSYLVDGNSTIEPFGYKKLPPLAY